MNDSTKNLLKSVGFEKEVEKVEEKKCPFCGSTKLDRKDFNDSLSWKEFHISGLCQACQNDVFREE